MKVLLVDDSALVRERLAAMLADLDGVEIVGQAQTVPEAMQAARTLSPDVVVLDIQMPGGSGLDVLRAMKRTPPTPLVIMLTNYALSQYRERCLAEGADFFLDKSTEFEKVIDVCKNLRPRPAPQSEPLTLSEPHREPSRAEEARIEAEDHYRSLFESVPIGLFRTTLEGRLMDANPALVQLLGYPDRETLLATNVTELYLDPEARRRWQALLGHDGVVRDYEVRARRYDGASIWGRLNSRAVRDAAGQVLSYEGTVEDITARKQAEQALEEEAQVSAALARVGKELIASRDSAELLDRLCRLTTEVLHCDHSSTVFWHPGEQAYVLAAGHGHPPEQLEMLRTLRFPRAALAELFIHLEEQAVVEGELVIPITPALGALLPKLNVTAILYLALRQGQELIGFQTAAYRGRTGFSAAQRHLASGLTKLASLALTNAKLFEELTRANRLKEDFLATMSHELRTPLNIIMGYTDLLLDGDLGTLMEEQATALRQVHKSSHELLSIVTSMLEASQLVEEEMPLRLEVVDAAELLEELKPGAASACEEAGLDLQWSMAADLPKVYTDQAKLKIVLGGLLNNAVKFTKKGSVSVETHSRDGGVEIRVIDTGIGIASEALPVIFELFQQGDDSTTRRYGGVGLGLYIARQLTELLGGKIAVESEVGKGSTFRVWVPVAGSQG